ncbi:MAG: hypothetical protein ACN2B6_06515 [Rickettsiales bacterium]
MVNALSASASSALSISRLDKNPTLTKNLKFNNEPAPAKVNGEAKADAFPGNKPRPATVDGSAVATSNPKFQGTNVGQATSADLVSPPTTPGGPGVASANASDTEATGAVNPFAALSDGPNANENSLRKALTIIFNTIESGIGSNDGTITGAELDAFFDKVAQNPNEFSLSKDGLESLRSSITELFNNISASKAGSAKSNEVAVTAKDFVNGIANGTAEFDFFHISSTLNLYGFFA